MALRVTLGLLWFLWVADLAMFISELRGAEIGLSMEVAVLALRPFLFLGIAKRWSRAHFVAVFSCGAGLLYLALLTIAVPGFGVGVRAILGVILGILELYLLNRDDVQIWCNHEPRRSAIFWKFFGFALMPVFLLGLLLFGVSGVPLVATKFSPIIFLLALVAGLLVRRKVYSLGHSLTGDVVEAYAYYSLASESDVRARKLLAGLVVEMRQDQIIAGQRRAEELRR